MRVTSNSDTILDRFCRLYRTLRLPTMARFTIIIAFATLQLAAGLAECSSLAGAFSILSKKGAACKVCGNYCGPAWCADANLAEGPACADATANWDTVKATDPTDSCCQTHGMICTYSRPNLDDFCWFMF